MANALQAILQQLADGTLPTADSPEPVVTLQVEVLSPEDEAEIATPSAPTRMMPLIQLARPPRPAHGLAGQIGLLLASLSGLASAALSSGIAALLSRDRPPSPPTTGLS